MAWHSLFTKYFSPYSEWARNRRRWRYLAPRNVPTSITPDSRDLVYKLNDKVMEVAQGSPSDFKGLMGLGLGLLAPVCGWFMLLLLGDLLKADSRVSFRIQEAVLLLLNLPFFALGCFAWYADFFGYTSAPMRFDRRQRKVWAFVTNRRQLEFDWDKLKVVTQQTGGVSKDHYFCNLLLVDEDEQGRVRWDGPLAKVVPLGEVRSTPTDAAAIYEFVRRFMEDGPEALPRCQHYLEHDRPSPRELVRSFGLLNFIHSWPDQPAHQKSKTLMACAIVLGVVFSWIILPFDIASYIARWTSRIPKWPAHIEAAAGGPMYPPPGAKSLRRSMRPHEWPFVILWTGSALAIYAWVASLFVK